MLNGDETWQHSYFWYYKKHFTTTTLTCMVCYGKCYSKLSHNRLTAMACYFKQHKNSVEWVLAQSYIISQTPFVCHKKFHSAYKPNLRCPSFRLLKTPVPQGALVQSPCKAGAWVWGVCNSPLVWSQSTVMASGECVRIRRPKRWGLGRGGTAGGDGPCPLTAPNRI